MAKAFSGENTVIGDTIVVRGELNGEENLTVLGRIEGTLNLTQDLLIESSGIVKAEVGHTRDDSTAGLWSFRWDDFMLGVLSGVVALSACIVYQIGWGSGDGLQVWCIPVALAVGVALLENRHGLLLLQRFAAILGLVMLCLFGLFAVTPLAEIWFRRVVGLSAPLTRMARVPMVVIASLPAVGSLISCQRGILVAARRTPIITRSVLINLVVLATVLIVLGYTLPVSGVLIAAIAYLVSVAAEWVYVYFATAPTRSRFLSVQT